MLDDDADDDSLRIKGKEINPVASLSVSTTGARLAVSWLLDLSVHDDDDDGIRWTWWYGLGTQAAAPRQPKIQNNLVVGLIVSFYF